MQTSKKERDLYFDNIKAYMIILVVFGHIAVEELTIRDLYEVNTFVYTFHMPVFIFLSGYFSKNVYKKGVFKFERVFQYFVLYVLFRFAWSLIDWAFTGEWDVRMFQRGTTPWYILALLIWMIFIPMIHEIRPRRFLVLSIALALFGGCVEAIGNNFALSRVMVFFPFFALGYYTRQKKLLNKMQERVRDRKKARVVATIIFFCVFVVTVVLAKHYPDLFLDLLGNLRYEKVYKDTSIGIPAAIAIRAFWYVYRFLMLGVILLIASNRRNPLTFLGQKTLQIYVIHILIRNVLEHLGLIEWMNRQNTLIGWAVTIGLTIALTLIPCLPVFDWLFAQFDRLRGVYTKVFRAR